MIFRRIQRNTLFIFLLLMAYPLFSLNFFSGYRAVVSVGQGSGKGFWDQTDTHENGNLHPLPGVGAALFGELSFSEGLLLEAALQYSLSSAGQDVGGTEYHYHQQSFELPLMIKKSPGNNRKMAFGLGPTLIYLPFKALRVIEESGSEITAKVIADQKILLGLQAGGEFRIPSSEKREIVLSLRFVHPLISPGYMWDESGSGNYRINRFDFGIGIRTKHGKEKYEL